MNPAKPKIEHPSDDLLCAIVKGQLGPNQLANILRHVNKCKRCQTVLDELRAEASDFTVTSKETLKTKSTPSPSKSAVLAQKTKPKVIIPKELVNHAQYKVLKLIGRGGMGDVFLVEHKLTSRQEVLKVIHSHLTNQTDIRDRFKREIQSAAKLNHPNVVQTLTAIEEGNLLGLVMEYVAGESLADMVKRLGPLPVNLARDFVRQIAMGLLHSHEQLMVHRDIKPQNILASKEGAVLRVRILDFGLAKSTELNVTSPELTIDGRILGTPHFMSPEQAINPATADIRSDLYSLGCTWFFLLTGKPPFDGDVTLAILNAHQNHTAPLASSFRSGIPAETELIIAKLMAKRAENRYQCPQELLDALGGSEIQQPSSVHEQDATTSKNIDVGFVFDKKPELRRATFAIEATKSRKRKKKKLLILMIRIAMFALPSIVLIGVLTWRPQWISELANTLRTHLSSVIEPQKRNKTILVLSNVAKDVTIYVDDDPAKLERDRADTMPSISLLPGTYKLSARRNNREFFRQQITLHANQILNLDIDPSKLDATNSRPKLSSTSEAETPTSRNFDSITRQELGITGKSSQDLQPEWFASARESLFLRDWKAWDQQVEKLTKEYRVDVAPLRRIQELVIEHDRLVREGTGTLQGGSMFEVQLQGSKETIAFVGSNEEEMTVRVRGVNRSFTWKNLPASIAKVLLNLSKSSSTEPRASLIAIGVCLSGFTNDFEKLQALEQLEEHANSLQIENGKLFSLVLGKHSYISNGVKSNAPLDINGPSRFPEQEAPTVLALNDEVLGKRFTIQHRLVGHTSSVFRLGFLQDGRLVSGEITARPAANLAQSSTHVRVWAKDRTDQGYPTEGAMVDFVASPNGLVVGHISKFSGGDLICHLLFRGKSVWQAKVEPTTLVGKFSLPLMSFSANSEEFIYMTRQGTFARYNVKFGKAFPVVACLENIPESATESIALSSKLDYAFFGMKDGSLKVVRTKDGKSMTPEFDPDKDQAKLPQSAVVASQLNSREKRIAILHADGTVGTLEFPSLNRLEDLPRTLVGNIDVVGHSMNNRFLAGIDSSNRVSVYDLDLGEVLTSWKLTKADVARSIGVENNGHRISIGLESGNVLIFQLEKE